MLTFADVYQTLAQCGSSDTSLSGFHIDPLFSSTRQKSFAQLSLASAAFVSLIA